MQVMVALTLMSFGSYCRNTSHQNVVAALQKLAVQQAVVRRKVIYEKRLTYLTKMLMAT